MHYNDYVWAFLYYGPSSSTSAAAATHETTSAKYSSRVYVAIYLLCFRCTGSFFSNLLQASFFHLDTGRTQHKKSI